MEDDIHQGLGPVASEVCLQGEGQADPLSGERNLLQDDMLEATGGQGLNDVHQRPAMSSAAGTGANLHHVPGHGSSSASAGTLPGGQVSTINRGPPEP